MAEGNERPIYLPHININRRGSHFLCSLVKVVVLWCAGNAYSNDEFLDICRLLPLQSVADSSLQEIENLPFLQRYPKILEMLFTEIRAVPDRRPERLSPHQTA